MAPTETRGGKYTNIDTYLPKVDPTLVHDLLIREHEKSEPAPFTW
jgi:hypothetical protein